MKYVKIIEPSGRKTIFEPLEPKDPTAAPPVVDEDLPEPTEQESDTDTDHDYHEDQLTREQQNIINSINRDETKADLQNRYRNNPSLNLEDLDENLVVLGEISRGTPVEPTDPEEPHAIEETWTHKVLQIVLKENASNTDSGGASKASASNTDSGGASKASDESKLATYKYNSRFMQENFYQK